MSLIELSDLSALLAARIDDLCVHLLPSGRREGREWVDARTSQGGLGDSMRVSLQGTRAGVWAHFACAGARGDALDLVAYVLFSGDKKKAIAWSKSWLGLDHSDPARLKQARAKARCVSKKRELDADQERENKRRYARSIWHHATPILKGTLADLYLLGRGIGLNDLPKIPGALRFSSKLKHPNGQYYTGIVAQINNHKGEFVGIHRTYLESRGGHVVTKIKDGEAKLTLGRWAGGFISLNRGASNTPFNKAPAGDVVILCEGIEDGLSLVMACPQFRVLSCINVGNLKNINLPPEMENVIIAADNDEEGSQAYQSVQAAVDRFLSEGRSVSVARSPVGKDFNDALNSSLTSSVVSSQERGQR